MHHVTRVHDRRRQRRNNDINSIVRGTSENRTEPRLEGCVEYNKINIKRIFR